MNLRVTSSAVVTDRSQRDHRENMGLRGEPPTGGDHGNSPSILLSSGTLTAAVSQGLHNRERHTFVVAGTPDLIAVAIIPESGQRGLGGSQGQPGWIRLATCTWIASYLHAPRCHYTLSYSSGAN